MARLWPCVAWVSASKKDVLFGRRVGKPLHRRCRVERPRLSQVISQLAYVLTSLPAVFALAECLSAAEAEAEEEAEAAAEAAAEEEELLLGCI